MKILATFALVPLLASAALLPDSIGAHARTATPPKPAVQPADQPLWDEFGLKESEAADYQKPAFTASLWRLSDTTAAMAAFYWKRPAASKPSKSASLAAETPDDLLLVLGNYLVDFHSYKPSKTELDALAAALPHVDRTPLPNTYLPSDRMVSNSDRYITGPAALKEFAPSIPANLAGFQFGAEVQSAVFRGTKGDVTLAVFNYPTPQIAMKQAAGFQQAGFLVQRSGPLVSVIPPSPADLELAQSLLGGAQYQAQVTVPEHIPTLKDNIGNLVINAFVLIGILLAIILTGGLFVAIIRIWQRRGERDPDANTVISLHLQ